MRDEEETMEIWNVYHQELKDAFEEQYNNIKRRRGEGAARCADDDGTG